MQRRLTVLIACMLCLAAMHPLGMAIYVGNMYAQHGMSGAAVFTASSSWLWSGLLYLGAALVYWIAPPKLRLLLQLAGFLYGLVSLWSIVHTSAFLTTWSIAHGNLLAMAAWQTVVLVLTGLLCLLHLVLDRAAERGHL